MRLLIIILTITFSHTIFAQIVNSISADKSGMFYYSVDTLISIVRAEVNFSRIVMVGKEQTIKEFPDKIGGVSLMKHDESKKLRKKDLRDKDILLKINGINIIRDQVTLSIGVVQRTDNRVNFWGAYIFYYKYLPETMTYVLTKIKK